VSPLPSPQTTPVDWQAPLLEAIHQRDVQKARFLAQRSVHRHGMQALETLLDRANVAKGSDGDDRTWLLLLLRQDQPEPAALQPESAASQPEPAPSQPEPAPAISAAAAEQSGQERESALLEWGPEPVRELDSGSMLEADPISAHLTQPDGGQNPVQPDEGSADCTIPSFAEPFPSSPSPTSPTASSVLDQAFAPLEIAFPPLPSADRKNSVTAPAITAAPSRPSLGDGDPIAFNALEEEDNKKKEEEGGGPSEALAFSQFSTAPSERGPELDHPSLIDDFAPNGVAAPVPNFQVEGSSTAEPLSRPPSPHLESTTEVAPSASPTLAGWRAWLPGAFRTRQRS
jgi:hypothetical protein